METKNRLESSVDSVDHRKNFENAILQEQAQGFMTNYKNDKKVNNDEEKRLRKLSRGLSHNFLIY